MTFQALTYITSGWHALCSSLRKWVNKETAMKTAHAFPPQRILSEEERLLHAQDGLNLTLTLEDMEVRAGLCTALADLSESMRALLGLMARHNFITLLPDRSFPAYEHTMERLSQAVSQAGQEVTRSRELDRRITLAALPSPAVFRQ